MELSGTAALMFLAGAMNASALQFGFVYCLLYHCYRKFNCRANFNPALTVLDVMRGACDVGDGFSNIVAQLFGAWLGRIIGVWVFEDGYAFTSRAGLDASFASIIVNEFFAGAILSWFWLSIHSDKDAWNFYGFDTFLMYWIAGSVNNSILNPARFLMSGEDKFKWWSGLGTNHMAYFFAPLLTAFIMSLVFAWWKK